ncbi:MAG: hypothetical protein DRJ56_04100 [Thermoprotei archaeon]|nr:MAG: hypothetical protein DRJ56_04100 [Thermoprotei archaeon]
MLRDFNLLVSTYRRRENDCISELWYFLREMGDTRVEVSRVGLPGLVVAKTSLDPLEVVRRLRKRALERPWDFRYILKVVPIQRVVPTDLEEIRRVALELSAGIGEGESYKVDVNIRLSELSRRDVIEAIAPHIDRKVNLTNPDKIIRVEVLGAVTGLSLLRPEDEVSIAKIKSQRRQPTS